MMKYPSDIGEFKMTPALFELGCAIAYHNQKVRELDLAKSEVARLTRAVLDKGLPTADDVRGILREPKP